MAEVRLCAFGIPALLALVLVPAVSAAQLVERVVDGDTIVVRGVGRVRLIGVDTPETVDPRRPVEFFGREASAFTKRLLEGQRVRLEYDRERADRYGRTLAYVYLRDGMLANAEIIRLGYGHAYTRFPFRGATSIVSAVSSARRGRQAEGCGGRRGSAGRRFALSAVAHRRVRRARCGGTITATAGSRARKPVDTG